MHNIEISSALAQKVPGLKLSCIACNVQVEDINPELWHKIQKTIAEINAKLKVEDISRLPAIALSRKAYKACGKDPARYRLSAEALLRRAVNRKEIYQVNNVVDCLNLVSVTSGFSIGGYDAGKINGDVMFGIGKENEAYSGIGRGELNISFMPVFRDDTGAFGTPTSDSVRTSVNAATKRFLMIIIDFGATPHLTEATQLAGELLTKYASAFDFEYKTIYNI